MLQGARHALPALRSTTRAAASVDSSRLECVQCARCALKQLNAHAQRTSKRTGKQPSTSQIPYSPPPTWARNVSSSSTARRQATAPLLAESKKPGLYPDTPAETDLIGTLERFLALESPAERLAARDPLCRFLSSLLASPSTSSDPNTLAPLSLARSDFDTLFARIAALESAVAAAVLKRLRDLARQRQRWDLLHEQKRQVLRARAAQEQFETRLRERRKGRRDAETEPSVAAGSEGEAQGGSTRSKSGRVVRARWRYLDECADDLVASVEARLIGRDETDLLADPDLRLDAAALEQYAARLVARSPTPSLGAANRITAVLRLALSTSPPLAFPEISPTYSAPLPSLFQSDPTTALALLEMMSDKGRLPTPAAIRRIISAYYRDPSFSPTSEAEAPTGDEQQEEAVYAHARQVLDEACSPERDLLGRSSLRPSRDPVSAKDRLELLLQERLERVERAEALRDEPILYLIRWLGLSCTRDGRALDGSERKAPLSVDAAATGSTQTRQAALSCALGLWEASQIRGRDEFEVAALQTSKSRVAKLFEALVLEACELEAAAAEQVEVGIGSRTTGTKRRMASPTLERALDLAGRYLRYPVLVHHAPRLLRAATVSANAPHLALRLFDILTYPPSDRSAYRRPFTWTLDLLPTFTSLFLSSAAIRDDSLPLRLYLSWTASGLSFPEGLWNPLWRALGRRGVVDEVARVVGDWEETGRGQVAGRISAMVLRAAGAATSTERPARVLAPLQLLSYFRSRYVRPGDSAPTPALLHSSPHLVVPLGGHVAVLHALARARADQRPAQRVVWRWLHRDGHTPDTAAFNAVIAAHVWRPDPHYTVKDLDDAGVVYNELIEAGRERHPTTTGSGHGRIAMPALAPDRETFSLLVHGFLRIADSPRTGKFKQKVTLEAALRTFSAAADRNLGVRGHQAARLVRSLAQAGSFEQAKEVQERWWRTLVALEQEWDRGRKGALGRSPGGGGGGAGRGEGMWEDWEVRQEMREMRMARVEVERADVRGREARVEAAALPNGADLRDFVSTEEDPDAQTPEAFETASLSSEATRT
ncbi:hypothetical protein JCM8202v2_002172 [Rhodotorula sphaerocarpa]